MKQLTLFADGSEAEIGAIGAGGSIGAIDASDVIDAGGTCAALDTLGALDTLDKLSSWQAAGWLRHLDVALARFIAETDPQAPTSLLLAAALVAHAESAGHTGLPVDGLHGHAAALLGWSDEAASALQQALAADWPGNEQACRVAWPHLAAVEIDPPDEYGTSPLVLDGPLLQLRRHWRAEVRVAREVLARVATPDDSADGKPLQRLLDDLFPQQPSSGAATMATMATGANGANEASRVTSATRATGASGATVEPPERIDWQRMACEVALHGRLTVVTGGPGTGKTYTAARMLVALQALRGERPPLRVALAAPTGKAAARLRQSITQALQELKGRHEESPGENASEHPAEHAAEHPDKRAGKHAGKRPRNHLALDAWADRLGPGRTLHALLGPQPGTRRFRHDASHPLEVDVLLVDEASMVHLELMAQLLDALPRHARLVLLGDKDQLASVEAGAVMGSLCRHAGDAAPGAAAASSPLARQTVMLLRARRFDGPIGELAQRVHAGNAPGALALLHDAAITSTTLVHTGTAQAAVARAAQGYRPYVELLSRKPKAEAQTAAFEAWVRQVLQGFDAFRVLCVVRQGPWGVDGLSRAIERTLAGAGLPAEAGEWYEGRPVMVLRNDAALGLFNGDIGVVLRGPASDRGLRAWFPDGDGLRAVPVGRLPQVETAFAMTVHKSQGSEFGHVALVLPEADVPVLTRELVYTGITRSKSLFTLLARDETLLARAIQRPTQRVGGLQRQLARSAIEAADANDANIRLASPSIIGSA